MSTTDHLSSTNPDDAMSSTGSSKVFRLDGLKRRKRLGHLLATRSHLATMAAQQRSHGLEEADESFTLQMAVETAIRDEFPNEFEEQFPNWLEKDATGEHPRGILNADCGICRSIAVAHGLNLVPPEAA